MRNENFLLTHIGRAKCSHCPAVALSNWHFRFYIFNVNQYTKVTIRLKRPIRMVIPAHMSCRDHVIYFGLSNSEGNLIVNCGIQFRVDDRASTDDIFRVFSLYCDYTSHIAHITSHITKHRWKMWLQRFFLAVKLQHQFYWLKVLGSAKVSEL